MIQKQKVSNFRSMDGKNAIVKLTISFHNAKINATYIVMSQVNVLVIYEESD